MQSKASNRKAYKNINVDVDAAARKPEKGSAKKLFKTSANDEHTTLSQPNIKNPVVVAIDGPGVYIGTVRIPYVRPPVVLPAFYESQKAKLKVLIKRIDSAGLHKSSKLIPKSLHLTFDQDVILDRAPVDSFLVAMNKRMQAAKPLPALIEKAPEPTLFEILEADAKKAIAQPQAQVAAPEKAKVIKYDSKNQTLATQLALVSIMRNEIAQKAEATVPTRPTVAYKDIQQTQAVDPLQTLSNLTMLHLKKLGKGNFAALGIDSPPNSQQTSSNQVLAEFQDVSGLLHFNRIQIDPLDNIESIISKIETKTYTYNGFDFLNKPLIRFNDTFQPQADSKQTFLEPQETKLKNYEKPILPPHFIACRTHYPELFRYIPFIESLKSLPLPDSSDSRRLLELISNLLPLPLSPELTLEYITLYDSLAGLDKLSARLRILFRERVMSILEIHQGSIRIKLARIYIDCAGDKEYAVGVMLMEGSQDVRRIIGDSMELLTYALGVILKLLRSSAPFERIRALGLVNSLVCGLDLVEILNVPEEQEIGVVSSKVHDVAKELLEEVLIMAWEDWSVDVKELCIKIISDLGLKKEIHKGIVLQLSSLNCTKQITAIKRVGEFKIVEGLAGLVPCLTNSHVMIRIEAFQTLAIFDNVMDREIIGGILAGCTDCEYDVRIAALQEAMRCTKGVNAQVRESLYYLLHYDPVERVREEVVATIQSLSLVVHFQASLTLICTSLKRCKLQEVIYQALTLVSIFIPKNDEKTASNAFHSEILLGPELYEMMSAKEREVVERINLVSEKEEQQLLLRVQRLCTKEAIISQATNQEYTPLVVPSLKLK